MNPTDTDRAGQYGGGQFFDGMSAQRHAVRIAVHEDGQTLVIRAETLPDPLFWRLTDLRALRDQSDKSRLTLTRHMDTSDESPRDPARLIVTDPDIVAWVHANHPTLYRRDTRPGTGWKVARYGGGALAAAALMIFVILPALAGSLARIIPPEREAIFGKTVVAQMERVLGGSAFGTLACTDPEGLEALDTMLARLSDGNDLAYDVQIRVFDHKMVNAFAAPGGQVVLMRGLLREADHPDEVAGVLAHEIGHVEARDATRHALRAAGSAGLLTMLIGDFTGGAAIALVGEQMLSASYTREAERAADGFALAMLDRAGVSSDGLATFFDKIDAMGGSDLPEYLSTHPAANTRADRARSEGTNAGAAPILNDAEWAALRAICD